MKYLKGMNDKMKKDDMSVILIRLTDKPRSVIKKVAQDNTLAVKKSSKFSKFNFLNFNPF